MRKRVFQKVCLSCLMAGMLSLMSMAALAEDGGELIGLSEESQISEEAAGAGMEEGLISLPEESPVSEEAAGVAINATNFNYPSFRAYVKKQFDLNKDGQLSTEEAKKVTVIDYYGTYSENNDNDGVYGTMKGLQYFTELKKLSFASETINYIDISGNTKLEEIKLEDNVYEIDLTHAPNLKKFDCNGSYLTALNVTKNPLLEELNCSCTGEGNLTKLNLTKNTKLKSLNCSGNSIKNLDLSMNTELEILNCSDNIITNFDISKNTRLKSLTYGYNISEPASAMEVLDLTGHKALETISLHNLNLKSVKLGSKPALTEIDIRNNKLTALDVTGCPALRYLYCDNNQIKSLNLKKNASLETLECYDNELMKLDISRTGLLKNYAVNAILDALLGYENKEGRSIAVYMTPKQKKNYLYSVEKHDFYDFGDWDEGDEDDYYDEGDMSLLSQDASYAPVGVAVDTKYSHNVTVYAVAYKFGKLGRKAYAYNGKKRTPSVTIKDNAGKTLIKGTDYTVTYPSGRKKVGAYKVTVKGKGAYSFSKTYTFKINPKKSYIKSLTPGKTSVKVIWRKRTKQVKGYQIQYTTSSSFSSGRKYAKITSNTKTAKTIKSLKRHKKYYFRIRTYKVVNGKTYKSAWSKKKSVTTN